MLVRKYRIKERKGVWRFMRNKREDVWGVSFPGLLSCEGEEAGLEERTD